jgi:hypothetical protein
MESNWAHNTGQAPDPFVSSNASRSPGSLAVDMDNLFTFDDSLFPINSGITNSNTTPDNLDYGYLTNENSLNTSNNPGLIMSQISKSTSYDQSTSPSDSLASGMGYDMIDPSLISPQTDSSPIDEWLLNPSSGEVIRSTEHDSSKRTRGTNVDDISACWKSPLCPNPKNSEGRPDSCHGECAEFLFANPSELPEDKKILAEIMAKSEPRVVLEPPSSMQGRLKRSPTTEGSGREVISSHSPLSPSMSHSSQASTPVSSQVERPKKSISTASSKKSIQPLPTPPAPYSSSKPKARVPHNQVEKKYRENVNAQLEALRRVVPSQNQSSFDGADIEDIGGSSARQPSKAAVLASATSYIRQLEKDNARMIEEMAALKTQNETLQSLVKCEDCSLMKYARNWRIGPQG